MASLGFIKDLSPIMAVELARRAIPQRSASHVSGNGRRLPRRRRGRFQGGISDGTATEARSPAGQPRAHLRHQRKKAGHGGHHGGAWKVAYADFVTAMMALFIVLWLMSADKK